MRHSLAPLSAGNQPIGIIDSREIEFDAKALVSAIAASMHRVVSIGLPPLRPSGVRFCPGDGVVEVLYTGGEKQKAVQVAAEKLGAFLVSYCIRARIPLPRLTGKDIRVQADFVILAFKTHYAEAPAPDDTAGGIRFARTRG